MIPVLKRTDMDELVDRFARFFPVNRRDQTLRRLDVLIVLHCVLYIITLFVFNILIFYLTIMLYHITLFSTITLTLLNYIDNDYPTCFLIYFPFGTLMFTYHINQLPQCAPS